MDVIHDEKDLECDKGITGMTSGACYVLAHVFSVIMLQRSSSVAFSGAFPLL